jgi:hypothetical protein
MTACRRFICRITVAGDTSFSRDSFHALTCSGFRLTRAYRTSELFSMARMCMRSPIAPLCVGVTSAR